MSIFRRPAYESDPTEFIPRLKSEKPELAAQQRRGRELLWDKLLDRNAWRAFRQILARYEPVIAVLGRMTDAPRSDWSSWSDNTPRHSPPLLRMGGS